MTAARVAALLARYGAAYAELGAGALVESRAALATRISLGVAGVVLGIGGLVASWGSLILILWNSESRNAVALTTALLLLGGGVLCLWRAAVRVLPGPNRSRLSRELQLDMELLQEWKEQNP